MIDTEALKKKTLKLAFEGRLSKHLPSDSNVNLIIEKCKEDKERSIHEGKYKNEVFRGSVENDSYSIPAEWIWMYISDMSLFQEGPGILAVDFRKEGVPLIRISGMDGQTVTLKDCNYLDPMMVEEKWNHFRLDKGDIVISSSASLDRIAEVDDVAEGAIPYTGLIRFKMYGGINKLYFKWFVQSPYYIEQVNNQKQGGFISHYGPTHLRKMKIPIPPIEEQGRIIERIGAIFAQIDLIDSLQQQYKTDIEVLKGKIIDGGIRGKLTEQLPEDGNADELYAQIQEEKAKLINEGKIKKEKPLSEISDDEIPFEIPENWKWVRFGETSYIVRGGSPRPIKSYLTDSENGINWIKIGDVEKGGKYIYKTKEKIIPEGEKKSRHVYPGDFLLTNSMSFGRPYISMIEGCIHDGWLLIRDLKGYSADYLYYLLSAKYMYGQFCNKASGATVDNLNIDKVNSALIPLPPLAEQIRIAANIESILKCLNK